MYKYISFKMLLLDSIFSEETCRTILKNYLFQKEDEEEEEQNKNKQSGKAIFLWRKFESLTGNVEGYLSNHFSLKITYQQKLQIQEQGQNIQIKEQTFFVKTMLDEKEQGFLATFAKTMDVFRKETFMYKKFFEPLEIELGRISTNTNISRPYKRILPKCYYAADNVLVLEDLRQDGYQLVEHLKDYDLEQCKMVLRTLSYYHAYSIIYEELKTQSLGRRFRLNEAYPDELADHFYGAHETSATAKFLEASVKTLIDLINELPLKNDHDNDDDDSNMKFKTHFIKLLIGNLNDDSDSDTERVIWNKYRMTCVHGDLWSSNIMFKMDECGAGDNHKIIDCKLIDFQMLTYTMAAYDVQLFLHGNTTCEFRGRHEAALLRHYHDSFMGTLREHGVAAADQIPTFDELQESCVLRAVDAKIQAISDKCLLYLPTNILQQQQQTVNNQVMEDPFKTVLIDERSKHILDVYRDNKQFQNYIQTELLDLYDILMKRQQLLIKLINK